MLIYLFLKNMNITFIFISIPNPCMTLISKYHLSHHVATIRRRPHTELVYDTCGPYAKINLRTLPTHSPVPIMQTDSKM